MAHHKLKISSKYFESAQKNLKPFEIRLNDRGFEIGDTFIMFEYDSEKYSGRFVAGIITFLTDFEQKNNYIVFAYKRLSDYMTLIVFDESPFVTTATQEYRKRLVKYVADSF